MSLTFSSFGFQEELQKHNISMAFRGIMSQEILSMIGWSLRKAEPNEVLSRRLFGLIIELAQNIHHYSAEKELSDQDGREIGCGIITISAEDDHYLINAGNLMPAEDADGIRERCKRINEMTSEELKQYYREQRRAPRREGKQGANVGFIEMVRKSGNPVEVNFHPADQEMENHVFFVVTVKFKKQLIHTR